MEWTIKELEEFIKDYPKDTKIVIESIVSGEERYCSDTEDVYYSEDSESKEKLLVFVPKEIEIINGESDGDEEVVSLLEKAVEEIENLYGKDTELTIEIRSKLNSI